MAWRWWAVAVFGAWFVACGWILSASKHSGNVQANFIVIGALILLGSLWSVMAPSGAGRWRDGVIALLSVWMAISPWTLGFAAHHRLDLAATLIVGILGLIGAGYTFMLSPETGGSQKIRPSA